MSDFWGSDGSDGLGGDWYDDFLTSIGINPSTTGEGNTSPSNQEILNLIGASSGPLDFLKTLLGGTSSLGKLGQVLGAGGIGMLLNNMMGSSSGPAGYRGGIPAYTATRTQTPLAEQRPSTATVPYRPGQGGITYFNPIQYTYLGKDLSTPIAGTPAPAPVPTPGPTPPIDTTPPPPEQGGGGDGVGMAAGGSLSLEDQIAREFARYDAMQSGRGYADGGTTREDVLNAYANTPGAVANPDEEAINYWMGAGLGNFQNVVNQVNASRAPQPTTPARLTPPGPVPSLPILDPLPSVPPPNWPNPPAPVPTLPEEGYPIDTYMPPTKPYPGIPGIDRQDPLYIDDLIGTSPGEPDMPYLPPTKPYPGIPGIDRQDPLYDELIGTSPGEPDRPYPPPPYMSPPLPSVPQPDRPFEQVDETGYLAPEQRAAFIASLPIDKQLAFLAAHPGYLGTPTEPFLKPGQDYVSEPFGALSMASAPTSRTASQGPTPEDTVRAAYASIGRTDIDPEGLTYWKGQLTGPNALSQEDFNKKFYGSVSNVIANPSAASARIANDVTNYLYSNPVANVSMPAADSVQVMRAFKVIPGANPNPSRADIEYYQKVGIGQLIKDVKNINANNPALAREIAAKRDALGLPNVNVVNNTVRPDLPIDITGRRFAAGGRFLQGAGDGVSDSIPAKFAGSGRPARLADGEFVIDARTVSEIGNGSSEAGARKLYAMMDRVHRARRSAKRGKPSGADKYLPK